MQPARARAAKKRPATPGQHDMLSPTAAIIVHGPSICPQPTKKDEDSEDSEDDDEV